MNKQKKIGLALSGGGYRSVAHVGVLKALEELKIKPSVISGTSAGSVIGAMYSAGYHWKEILDFLKESDLVSIKKYTYNKPGFLDSLKYIPLFSKIFPKNDFRDLEIPMYVTTTDLIEAKTKYFNKGELILPLIASCAIPGVFSPVRFNGAILCDGGVTNNLPTEPLLSEVDMIIGVNLSPLQNIDSEELRNAFDILQRAYYVIRKNQSERNFKDCDVLISPESLSKYNILSKNNFTKMFEVGYNEVMKKLVQ